MRSVIHLSAVVFLLFIGSFQALAQFPVNNSAGKWGAIDKGGKVIISLEYDFISPFDERGFALAKKGERFGVINGAGKLVIPADYDRVLPASNFFVCFKGLHCGLINTENRTILPFEFDFIRHFAGTTFLLMKEGKLGVGLADGTISLEPAADNINPFGNESSLTSFVKNGKSGVLSSEGKVLLDPIADSLTISGNSAKAWQQRKIFLLEVNEKGELLKREEFVNQAALDLAKRTEEARKQAALLKEQPDLKKARWQKFGFRYKLVNGVGKDLLGKEFFDVGLDPNSGLSLARELIGEEEDGKVISYLVDLEKEKIIFSKELEDVMITDFSEGGYARATVDTLWDALVNQKGELLESLISEGKSYTIDNIGNFNSGLAWVKSGSRYGFINPAGEVKIPFAYEVVSDFQNGYAIAKKEGLFGCLNAQGSVVIPFKYDGIALPSQGFIRVKRGKGNAGKWGLISLSEKQVLPFEYDFIGEFFQEMAVLEKAGFFGLINTSGKVILSPQLKAESVEILENGLLKLQNGLFTEGEGLGKTTAYRYSGYALPDGQVLLEPIYTNTGNFEEIWTKKEGLTKIKIGIKTGYINYKGQLVMEAKYDQIDGFENIWGLDKGISRVVLNKKVGYVNHRGEEIIPAIYDQVNGYEQAWKDSTSLARAQKSGAYGLLNYAGETVIPFEYQNIKEASDKLVLGQKGSFWGAVNLKNQEVIPFENDGIRFLEVSDKELVGVLKEASATYFILPNGQYSKEGLVDDTQPSISISSKYPVEKAFAEAGLGVVKKEDTRALVDQSGNTLTKFAYREIRDFSEGMAVFQKDDKNPRNWQFGYLSEEGKEVISPIYQDALPFQNGLAPVKSKNRWGIIDQKGNWVLPPTYSEITAFSEGFATAEKSIILDKTGKEVGKLPFDGEVISGFSEGLSIAQTDKGLLHIKPDGIPAYAAYYDEVTPFIGDRAFAKKGEIWLLTRQFNKSYQNQIKFTKAGMLAYKKQYGEKRKIKTPYGDLIEDIKWEKANEGVWKMIGKDGTLINDATFSSVDVLPNKAGFKVTLKALYGVMDSKGNELLTPAFETLTEESQSLIRLEKGGQIHYLNRDGKQIWPAK